MKTLHSMKLELIRGDYPILDRETFMTIRAEIDGNLGHLYEMWIEKFPDNPDMWEIMGLWRPRGRTTRYVVRLTGDFNWPSTTTARQARELRNRPEGIEWWAWQEYALRNRGQETREIV